MGIEAQRASHNHEAHEVLKKELSNTSLLSAFSTLASAVTTQNNSDKPIGGPVTEKAL
jgi:hypothetical protein